MKKLFFDIETVPAPADKHDALREIYEAKRAKKQANGKRVSQSFDDFVLGTSFQGEFGRIVCIAHAADDGPVEVLWGEEPEILEGFWKVAAGVTQFIGHNILEFDFPFIIKRSRVLGIKPSVMPKMARYSQTPIYDTMKEWDLWSFGNNTALHTLAVALDLPTSKDDLDGSQVWPAYQAGKIEEICRYCKQDVELTRQVYQKMEFDGALPRG